MENITTLAPVEQFIKVTIKEAMDAKDKAIIIAAANKFTSAKREMGDVQTAFAELVNTIKQMEVKYNVVVFNDQQSMSEVVDHIAGAIDVATTKFYGAKSHVCSFKTVEEANNWLDMQKNIIVKDMVVEAKCSFGIHEKAIKIEYQTSDTPLNQKYRIDTIDKFRVFVSSKLEKVKKQWLEKNPQFKSVKVVKKQWGFSLIGGSVGVLRFIKERYFVAYSYNI